MKWFLVIVLAAMLALSACGAPAAPAAPAAEESQSQIPNPVVEADSAAMLADFGYPIDAPAGAEDISYSIIGNWIAQVQFTLNGCAYTYRAAIADEQDIAGVFETFDAEAVGFNADGDGCSVAADIRTVDGGKSGTLAVWTADEAQFSLYTSDETELAPFEDVILELAEAWHAAK